MSISLARGGFQNRLAREIALMRASKCLDEVVEVDDVVEDGGWNALGCAGPGWGVLGWAGLGWAGLGCAGMGWVTLGWAVLGWAGLGWAGLGMLLSAVEQSNASQSERICTGGAQASDM